MREIGDLGKGISGHLRIGVTVGSHEQIVANAAAKLMKASPRITLSAPLESLSVLLHELRRGEIDLFVTVAPSTLDPGIVQEQVQTDRFVVYGSARHRLAHRRKVPVSELTAERWAFSPDLSGMPRFLLQRFAELGQSRPNIVVSSNSIALRLAMIAESELLGFGAERLVHHAQRQYALSVIRVEGFEFVRRSVVMYREDGYLPPAARRLIELLKHAKPGLDWRADRT